MWAARGRSSDCLVVRYPGMTITSLQVSISLGSTCSWAADSYLLPPGGGLSLQNSAKDTAQRMTFRP